jgi:cyclic di-GMP phosphodiesterase Gmr
MPSPVELSEDQDLVLTFFGTQTPHWKLSLDSDVVQFFEAAGRPARVGAVLSNAQVKAIQSLTAADKVRVEVAIFGSNVAFDLAGRKLDALSWGGIAMLDCSAKGSPSSPADGQLQPRLRVVES